MTATALAGRTHKLKMRNPSMIRIFLGALAGAVVTAGGLAAWSLAQEDLPAAPQRSGGQAANVDARHYSYAIGLDIGQSFRSDDIQLDVENLLAGVRDGLQAADPRFDRETCVAAMQRLTQIQLAALKKRNADFIANNRTAEGVEVTESGLQYTILRPGNGPSPGPQDRVKVHYQGQLLDGSVFDSSIGGEPAQFRVDQVIPGWTEALQKMRVGSHWRLFVPSRLAYREKGAGDVIPPHSALIFDVELLEIMPK